ncbi:MAG TPA: hypothetical protein VKG44_11045, partial [Candidatus Baltobacteraceae bacterium]|nr:hypothetical protein [Candidatus Baltobacteraceae bacterium]
MRRSAALISIFLLAGCGLLGKPESLAGVFSPPPGWRELRLPFAIAINPVLGAWRANASSDERIVVMRLPVNDERSVIDSIEAGGTHDPSISSRKRITLCRGIDGLELEVHGNGRRLASNTTMTTVIAATRA